MPRVSKFSQTASSAEPACPKVQPSLVEQIERVLQRIYEQMDRHVQRTPSVQAWIDLYGSSATGSRGLDWSAVPAAVDSGSTAMGLSTAKSEKKRARKLLNLDVNKVNARVLRKRQQVESFCAVLQPIIVAAAAATVPGGSGTPSSACTKAQQQANVSSAPVEGLEWQQQQQQQPRLHIVDFGCGTGNLLLPLAALFPCCRFTGVDMKPAALQLLQQRAAAAGLSNVSVFEGMIEQFDRPFDVALALHACGNATDHVLQMAVHSRAAFIVSPCCVGKLKFSMSGGSSFHSSAITWTPSQPGDKPPAQRAREQQQQQQQQQQTLEQQQEQPYSSPKAQRRLEPQHFEQQQQDTAAAATAAGGLPPLQHPRSAWLRRQLPQPEQQFRVMARVADIAHAPADQVLLGEALAQRAAVADTCKRFVELDRCAAAAEAGYAVGLFKVLGADSMAKNDLLLGLPLAAGSAAAVAAAAAAAVTANNGAAAIETATAVGGGSTSSGRGDAVGAGFRACSRQLVDQGLLFTAAMLGG
ncbi:hypothetical protein COO60DRAFT_215250 [Scenedesmus sp. NREL 46B-D3]|nr:hypothetical protein COO60DRAFT_215250 [Scenedesmus sp. NREL 46B-D3]